MGVRFHAYLKNLRQLQLQYLPDCLGQNRSHFHTYFLVLHHQRVDHFDPLSRSDRQLTQLHESRNKNITTRYEETDFVQFCVTWATVSFDYLKLLPISYSIVTSKSVPWASTATWTSRSTTSGGEGVANKEAPSLLFSSKLLSATIFERYGINRDYAATWRQHSFVVGNFVNYGTYDVLYIF